jgi:hypothetical protein
VRPPGETLAALLDKGGRPRSIVVDRAFVGPPGSGGPLARFLQDRRGRALDLYLLLHAVAGEAAEPVALPASVWARALGIDDIASPEVLLSRTWTWLERERLVTTRRAGRLRAASLLHADGSGSLYRPPVDAPLVLPHAYFLGNFHNRIRLAGKAVLLAALAQNGEFAFVSGPPATWHGLSRDSVKRGLRVLLILGLMNVESVQRRDPLSAAAYKLERRYALAGPFRRAHNGSEPPLRRRIEG